MASILWDKTGKQVTIGSAAKATELLKAGYTATKPEPEVKQESGSLAKRSSK